jgi:oligopeptide/dipeptide ABC transporter ATP-binding protein
MTDARTEDRGNAAQAGTQPLLRMQNLKKYFHVPGKGELHAVDNVSLDIMPRETLGLVGESGCGKSTVGNLIVRLHKATSGHLYFNGLDLVSAKNRQVKGIRRNIQMIFQDPFSSLNPRQTVQAILAAPLMVHGIASGTALHRRVQELAEIVGLEAYVLAKYPHELDGGKRQMVGIARALSLEPTFIVCDEPVSSLDVSVQATIINLLIDMQARMGLTYLFISHDLSVVRHISNRVAVMYLGEVVELAETDTIFANTLHPYSIALLSAVPKLDCEDKGNRIVLNGDVPSPLNPKSGCRFAPRCWIANDRCKRESPPLSEAERGHFVACHFWSESRARAAALTRV